VQFMAAAGQLWAGAQTDANDAAANYEQRARRLAGPFTSGLGGAGGVAPVRSGPAAPFAPSRAPAS
jgi:hypothetical protein